MKNLVKLIGIIAFVAIIGFSFVSCEEVVEETDELDGTTWKATGKVYNDPTEYPYTLTFDTPKFTISETNDLDGTYSISDDKVTLTVALNTTYEGTLSENRNELTFKSLFAFTPLVFTKQ